MACIGVAGDGLEPAGFPRVGWTGIGVPGDGLACGLDFGAVEGVEPGVGTGVGGLAFTGPTAGEGTLLCSLLLRGVLREPEGVFLPGVPYAWP